jgi:L-alanine-DL-glutamate epimerase-like enolase superfamily enzyme
VALLVRVEDGDGAHGWGEVWCNFPPAGGEHKLRLLAQIIGPALVGRSFAGPEVAWIELSQRMRRNAIQSAEPGNFAAAIAGIDVALWDLAARRAGVPLWRLLGREAAPLPLPVYASNLNPKGAPEYVAMCREKGYRAFKLKVAFDLAGDLDNVRRIMGGLGAGERFMVDATQGWDMGSARIAVQRLSEYPLGWIEEAICADEPAEHWAELAMLSAVPLSGGENLMGFAAFDEVIRLGHLKVIQPDICKWGGITGCRRVAERAVAAGRSYCPHWLNSGLGLHAAAHLLAAVGGGGLLEHDAMENPLQAVLAEPFPAIVDGRMAVTSAPGLGVAPDLAAARPFLVEHREVVAAR